MLAEAGYYCNGLCTYILPTKTSGLILKFQPSLGSVPTAVGVLIRKNFIVQLEFQICQLILDTLALARLKLLRSLPENNVWLVVYPHVTPRRLVVARVSVVWKLHFRPSPLRLPPIYISNFLHVPPIDGGTVLVDSF